MMSETFVAKIIVGGRITIPESVRDVLGLKEGDLVRAVVEKANKTKGA